MFKLADFAQFFPADEKLLECARALRGYMFLEQTLGGRNPHKQGSNKYNVFEAGRAALGALEGSGVKV
jgi:hypothetical protein